MPKHAALTIPKAVTVLGEVSRRSLRLEQSHDVTGLLQDIDARETWLRKWRSLERRMVFGELRACSLPSRRVVAAVRHLDAIGRLALASASTMWPPRSSSWKMRISAALSGWRF